MTRLAALAEEERTIIIYESPYRLVKTLGQLAEVFGGERNACVARELTKKFEENRRGTLSELYEWYGANAPKGEIVLVVEGKGFRRGDRNEGQDTEEAEE